MAVFCSISDKSLEALYKLTTALVIKNKPSLNQLMKEIYDTVYNQTNNQDQALTYAHLVPKMLLIANDKFQPIKPILDSLYSIGELNDTFNKFTKNGLDDVADYLAIPVNDIKIEKLPTSQEEVEEEQEQEETPSDLNKKIKELEKERDEKLRKLREEKEEIEKELKIIEEKAEKIKSLEGEKAEILKELEFIENNKPKDTLEQQKVDIERRRQEELLGKSFIETTEKVVISKGQSNGKTIVRFTESKISSDSEVLIIKPKAKFKNEDTSLSTTPETITVKEFREQFYENLSEQDKEMFDEFFTDDSIRIKLVEARIGLKGNAKGQVNIDVESLEGQPFAFELQNGKEINAKYDAELAALEVVEESKNKPEPLAPLELTSEEKEEVKQFVPEAIEDTLSEDEKIVVQQVAEENKKSNQTEQEFIAEQVTNELEGKESELKGENEKISLFRKLIKKIAKYILGFSIIWAAWTSASPMADYLNRNNIVTREKTTFVMDLARVDQEITEKSFTDSQKDMILTLIKKAESNGKSSVTYNDYPSGYTGVQFDKTSTTTRLNDTSDETVVKRIVGQFDFQKVGDVYVINDKYNFNDAGTKSFGEGINYVLEGLSDSTLNGYGKIRRFGTAFGSKEGEGADIRIEIKDKNIPIGASIAASFLLLGTIRRKRENGEDITDDDIESLKNRIKQIEDEIKETEEFYKNAIEDLKKADKETIYGILTEDETDVIKKKEQPFALEEIRDVGPSNINLLDEAIDNAREKGKFVFDTVFPREIQTVDGDKKSIGKIDNDGNLLLKTLNDKKLLRQHNYLNNVKLDEHKIEIQLVTEQNKNWFYQRDEVMPKIVAVITDLNGNILNFNDEGAEDDNGSPLAFEYEYNYYNKENLTKSRKSIMGLQGKTIKNPFGNTSPLSLIVDILNSGKKITGSIATVMEGEISSLQSTNTPSYNQKDIQMRTFGELVEKGFENQMPTLRLNGYSLEYAFDNQRTKIGQPYLYDEDSQLYISLRGKKLKDLTLEGKAIFENENTMLYKVIETLNRTGKVGYDFNKFNDEVIFSNEMLPHLENIYEFLKNLLYKRNFRVEMTDNMRNIQVIRGRKGENIWDAEINFVRTPKKIKVPLASNEFNEVPEINYEDLMLENFVTGAVKAKIDNNKPAKFEKLNRRLVIALDSTFEDLQVIAPDKRTKPNINLLYVSDSDLINSENAQTLKLKQDNIKKDEEDLKKLIDCLW